MCDVLPAHGALNCMTQNREDTSAGFRFNIHANVASWLLPDKVLQPDSRTDKTNFKYCKFNFRTYELIYY